MAGDIALPNLYSRLQIDTTQLSTAITAVDATVNGYAGTTDKATKSSDHLSEAHGRTAAGAHKTGEAHKKAAADINHLSGAFEKAQRQGEEMLKIMDKLGREEGALGRVGGIIGSTAGIAGPAAGPLLAAGGIFALGASLDALAESVSKHSAQVLIQARNLGTTNTNMQVYQSLAEAANVDNETLYTSFSHFNRELATGAPMLGTIGLTLKDVGITTTNFDQALRQVTQSFGEHTNEAQKAVVVQALFGRQGLALLPILNSGVDVFKRQEDEMRKFGLLLDDSALKQGALAEATRKTADEALHGAFQQIGSRLQEAFTQVYLLIIAIGEKGSGPNGVFGKIGQAVGTAVSWVVSLANALFGLGITQKDLDDVMKSSANTIAQGGPARQQIANDYKNAKTEAQAAQEQIDALRASTTAQTQAISDDVKARQERQRVFDEDIAQRKQALTLADQEVSYNDQRTASLEALAKAEERVRVDQSDLAGAVYEGNFKKQQLIEQKLTDDKQTASDDRRKFGEEAIKREHALRIQALDDEKKRHDEVTAAAIRGEEARSQAIQRAASIEEKRLQDIVTAASAKNASITASDNAANAAMLKGVDSTLLAVNVRFNEAGNRVGATLHKLIFEGFDNPEVRQGLSRIAGDLGNLAGNAFVAGVKLAIKAGLSKLSISMVPHVDAGGAVHIGFVAATSAPELLGRAAEGLANLAGIHAPQPASYSEGRSNALGFASGGFPPVGVPYKVGEHGPEWKIDNVPSAVFNKGQMAELVGAGGGGAHTTINVVVEDFTGDSDRLAGKIGDHLGTLMGYQ